MLLSLNVITFVAQGQLFPLSSPGKRCFELNDFAWENYIIWRFSLYLRRALTFVVIIEIIPVYAHTVCTRYSEGHKG